MREYFHINVSKYNENKTFEVVRPASLNNPKDNAVMFVVTKRIAEADALLKVENCLVFWPMNLNIPEDIAERHLIVKADNPRLSYSMFFLENGITNLPLPSPFDVVGGAHIERGARIGSNCVIFPDVYIGKDVTIGNGVYIGSGVKLLGEIVIGDNVVIRDNTVIGADGLTTNRGVDGKAVTMPQFGGVRIENDVQIGANVVIARGAIDNTEICRGSKIDNCTFISHNVIVGEDTFIVGETIMFGSSSTGRCVLLSGNSTIREGVHIGDGAVVGMGAVVVKPVDSKSVVKGNPAK
jgi:UDP-3-O-[3-hydroxymyristoyl] glucosamine N-acyltransferase